MRDGLSQSIVDFIAGLLPLYTHDYVGDIRCARSLQDGTLLIPMTGEAGREDGWVTVLWQGATSRKSEVQGAFLASLAIARYVELRSIVEHPRSIASKEMEHMAQHFTFKTGESVTFESPDSDADLFQLVRDGVAHFGKDVLTTMLKTQLGL